MFVFVYSIPFSAIIMNITPNEFSTRLAVRDVSSSAARVAGSEYVILYVPMALIQTLNKSHFSVYFNFFVSIKYELFWGMQSVCLLICVRKFWVMVMPPASMMRVGWYGWCDTNKPDALNSVFITFLMNL